MAAEGAPGLSSSEELSRYTIFLERGASQGACSAVTHG